jgi:hypothetical protein
MKDLKNLYEAAMNMLDLDEPKSGYKFEGKTNKQGFPILDCKDGTHSLEVITFNLGYGEEE